MFDKEVYAGRRQQLKGLVGSGVILLPGNGQSSMSFRDNWYPFRQDSNFLYYTGLDMPFLAVVIDIDNDTEIVFGDELTEDDIIWHGHQPSLREMAALSGIASSRPYKELETFIKTAQSVKRLVHYLPPYRPEHTQQVSDLLSIPPGAVDINTSVILIKAIVSMRSVKTPLEITEIQKAVNISVDMQLAGMQAAKPGLTEAAVAALVQGVPVSRGGNISFPTILTTRGEVLHNHYTNNPLPAGKLVLLDCGAETAMHYAGDLTRTFPVDSTFTTLQKDMYNIVLTAQQAAIDAIAPGILFKDIYTLAAEKLTEGLVEAGLMKGDPKEAVAAGAHTLFFQCGLGHMMGLDVHDMESLGEQYVGYTPEMKKSMEFGLKSLRLGRALEKGFVITIEPGLYFIPELMDRWSTEKKHTSFINYEKLSAARNFGGLRVEDDYLVTADGAELLGNALPRTVEEIEKLRQAAM